MQSWSVGMEECRFRECSLYKDGRRGSRVDDPPAYAGVCRCSRDNTDHRCALLRRLTFPFVEFRCPRQSRQSHGLVQHLQSLPHRLPTRHAPRSLRQAPEEHSRRVLPRLRRRRIGQDDSLSLSFSFVLGIWSPVDLVGVIGASSLQFRCKPQNTRSRCRAAQSSNGSEVVVDQQRLDRQ